MFPYLEPLPLHLSLPHPRSTFRHSSRPPFPHRDCPLSPPPSSLWVISAMRWFALLLPVTLFYSLSFVNAIPHEVDEKRHWLHKRQDDTGSSKHSVPVASSATPSSDGSSPALTPTSTPATTTQTSDPASSPSSSPTTSTTPQATSDPSSQLTSTPASSTSPSSTSTS